MKIILSIILALFINSSIFAIEIKDGDILFHVSKSAQGPAIEKATHSKYTHTGIVIFKDSIPYVLEAVQPVRYTIFSTWIRHGKNEHYLIKRLKNRDSILTANVITKMKEEGKKYLNKDYDIYFNWSDDELYCSELVWKVYKQGANIKLCKLNKLKEYDLSHKEVQKIMKKRYGDNPPLEDYMVSPQDIFDSELLVEIE